MINDILKNNMFFEKFKNVFQRKNDYDLVKNSIFFDEEYYVDTYDIDVEKYDPVEHYLSIGYLRGYNPSPIFDAEAYYNSSNDVKLSKINPLIHYLKYGKNESRPIKSVYTSDYDLVKNSIFFDEEYYVDTYDIDVEKYDPVEHYLSIGYLRGYNPSSIFDAKYYYKRSEDISKFRLNPLLHFIKYGKYEGRPFMDINKSVYNLVKKSGLFDEHYYINTYNINYKRYDPLIHYLTRGYLKNYNPSVLFNTSLYYELEPDVKEVNMNPLVHYLRFGRFEKRKFTHIKRKDYNLIKNSELFDEEFYVNKYNIDTKLYDPVTHYLIAGYLKNYNPSKQFDTEYYMDLSPDIRKSNINPLVHFIRFGHNEGRPYDIVNKNDQNSFKNNLLQLLYKSDNFFLLFKSNFNIIKFFNFKKDYNLIKNSDLFDNDYYEKRYQPNINEVHSSNLLLHYMFLGFSKNYRPNMFMNLSYYQNKYDKSTNPLINYLRNESNTPYKVTKLSKKYHDIIAKSGLFDKKYYEKNYNIPKYFPNSLYHYLNIGYKKGYNPNKDFKTKWYLETYPGVAKYKKYGWNPLLHYVIHGIKENKMQKPINKEDALKIKHEINEVAMKMPLYNFDENAPKVSIIILTRDGLGFLKTLFKNFEETICYPNYEVIVIDNDSKDDSVLFLKEISKKIPMKIIQNEENESFSAANNKGVDISTGEFVLLLNNDMEPIYGWLNHMMASYFNNENVGIVGSKLIYPYRKNNATSLKTQNEGIKYMELNGFLKKNDGYVVPYNIKGNDIFPESLKDEKIASVLGASLLIKKELYLELGGLDDEYIYNYEDIDLCFKVIKAGYDVIFSPKSKLYHYYQATRKEAFDVSPRDMKNRTYLYRKWNKWLTYKLFMDKYNNELIFSKTKLNFTYITNKTIKLLEDEKTFINEKGWNFKFKNIKNRKYFNKDDIILTDSYKINPKLFISKNKHQLKIAIIHSQLYKWDMDAYDLILVNKWIYKALTEEEKEKCWPLMENESVFTQIDSIISNLYDDDLDKFNTMIHNYDFEETYPNAINYLAVLESEYFDEKWYMTNYDIDGHGMDPAEHYLKIGGFNGFNPGPVFNSQRYLECNEDVQKAHINPLVHYERFGIKANRKPVFTDEEYDLYLQYKQMINEDNYENTISNYQTNENQILFYSPWDLESDGQLSENCQIIYDLLGDNYNKVKFTHKHVDANEKLDLLKKFLESKIIITDSSIPFLSEFKIKEDQYVINIWHACGTFKKIGLDVPSYSEVQRDTLKAEAEQYSNFIVSSENSRKIYADAHDMPVEKVLSLGVPRTDIFYDDNYKKEELNLLYQKYPNLKDKEIILYAPTFRDSYILETYIDWDYLSNNLDDNELIIIKRHTRTPEDLLNGKTYDNIFYLEDESLYTLMFASKLLVTDYSSVIFEYSLLNKPVIHYCPDLDKYLSMRDFYLNFNSDLFGDIIINPDKFVEKLINKEYEVNDYKLKKFKEKFMGACDGKSTQRIIKLITDYIQK